VKRWHCAPSEQRGQSPSSTRWPPGSRTCSRRPSGAAGALNLVITRAGDAVRKRRRPFCGTDLARRPIKSGDSRDQRRRPGIPTTCSRRSSIFFTTKEVARAPLGTVPRWAYAIVQEHGGRIPPRVAPGIGLVLRGIAVTGGKLPPARVSAGDAGPSDRRRVTSSSRRSEARERRRRRRCGRRLHRRSRAGRRRRVEQGAGAGVRSRDLRPQDARVDGMVFHRMLSAALPAWERVVFVTGDVAHRAEKFSRRAAAAGCQAVRLGTCCGRSEIRSVASSLKYEV